MITAYHVKYIVETSYPLPLGGAKTGDPEDSWGVNCHTRNTNPLLHDLEPDDKLDAASGVELTSADAEKHVDIRVALGGLSLKLGDVADILEFSLGHAHVRTSLTTESAKNVASFFLATDLGEPTWGLGEEPDNGEEEEQWENLEGDGETPDEGRLTVLVK